METYIVVGLGNPGSQYARTRHNAGWEALEELSRRWNAPLNKKKFDGLIGETNIGGNRVILCQPQTFMNASGEAVQQAAAFYKIPMENVLVFSDDTALDVGRIRVRKKGSDGGQRGLRSIIRIMNTDEFPRIRFGVGQKPHPDYDLADWVLSDFNKDEQKLLFAAFEKAYDGAVKILQGDVDGAMQLCNGK